MHIGIIMDGNGRWATRRGLTRSDGHRAGAETVRRVVTACCRMGISVLTLYAFSRENWSRPKDEVSLLFDQLVYFLGNELPAMQERQIRLCHFGGKDELPLAARKTLDYTIKKTAGNTGMTLNLAINYSGREEIVRACREIIKNGAKPEDVSVELVQSHLYSAGQPDPDLIIRTSGEQRISNFLLFQCAYSEYYFTEVLWPDFGEEDLKDALASFAGRIRRFGRAE
jgi:undecaprenyl diphosphate synthase